MVSEATKLLTLNDVEAVKEKIGVGYIIKQDFEDYEYSKGAVMRNIRCQEPFCRSSFNKDEYKELWEKTYKK